MIAIEPVMNTSRIIRVQRQSQLRVIEFAPLGHGLHDPHLPSEESTVG